MRTVLLLVLLLLTAIDTCVSDFKLLPLGDDIAVAICKITAGNDSYFSSTVPYLKKGKDGQPFEFVDAWDELGSGFHGDHYPDTSNPTLLYATLSIRDYTSADLEEKLFCSATLNNDSVIQYPLVLEERRKYSLCHLNWSDIRLIVVVGVVLLITVVLLGIVITVTVVCIYRKRFTRSYQVEDEFQKQQSPVSSYHTAGHDISLEIIRTEVEDTQENVQESEKTKYWTK